MKKNTKIIIIAVLVVAVIATAGIVLLKGKDTTDKWLYQDAKYEELICTETFEGEAVLYLQKIHNTPYYTPDAIAKMGESAYSYILLSQLEEEQISQITAYTDCLSVEQLDFLALQIENAMGLAKDLINGDKNAVALFETLDTDKDILEDTDEEDLTDLYKFLYTIFDEKGVTHEWKLFDTDENHSFEEFFK